MQGRKIIFRAKPRTDKDSNAPPTDQPEPHAPVKRPRAPDAPRSHDVVFVLKKRGVSEAIPRVSDFSAFREELHRDVGQMRPRAIPARLKKVENLQEVKGDVYAFMSEHRSAPSTPLPRTRSGDRSSKHEHEDKVKHDAFDGAVDELLIVALELKALLKSFLPERDSVKLEEKLQEYLALLTRMEEMTNASSESERERQNVSMEMWDAMDDGVHPDVFLMERSDEILKQAECNIKTAQVIERFIEIGKNIPNVDNR